MRHTAPSGTGRPSTQDCDSVSNRDLDVQSKARLIMTASLPSVLCPVDFSEPSRSALCYASAVFDHFGVRLTLLAVDDPLPAATGQGVELPLGETTLAELKRFCRESFQGRPVPSGSNSGSPSASPHLRSCARHTSSTPT